MFYEQKKTLDPRVRIEAQIHGGGHERGMRSGTLPTHQLVGMGEAFRIAKIDMKQDIEKIKTYIKYIGNFIGNITI